MLNITIYSKVPLQKNYQNVLNISQTNFDSFLNNYYEGEISNVKTYFDGGDTIELNKLYENCNYMRIEDTNSPQQIKYYFIDSTQFKAGGTVKYNITLDIWHTYKYNIHNFYNSLFIRGHADALNKTNGILKLNSYKIPKLLNRNDLTVTHLTNYLIEPLDITTNTTRRLVFLALVSTSNGMQLLCINPRAISQNANTNLYNYNKCLLSLYKNKYWTKINNVVNEITYEIIKLYCITDYDFLTNITGSYEAFINDTGSIDVDVDLHIYSLSTTAGGFSYSPFMRKITLYSKNIYNTSISDTIANRKLRSKRRVLIGAMNNNKELNTFINFNDNPVMSINMYLEETNAIQIMFELENTKIDITSNFELPTVNDNYTLYMNLNQKQIENENITNAVSYLMSSVAIGAGVLLSPFTSGASLALAGVGFATATASFVGKETGINAKIQDAKNSIDRLDNTNTNIGLTFAYGVGAFEFEFEDEYLSDNYNRFGCENQIYIDTFEPLQPQNYNFTFIQFQDVNFDGAFNENIKMVLKAILENGVRIWYDPTTFLTNVNYIKGV